MASFMTASVYPPPPAMPSRSSRAKWWKFRENPPKRAGKRSKNANDHEQQARVHPAQPSYSVVVPAPELSSVNVAVINHMGMIAAICKGATKISR
jgi:hypothetical protein